MSARNTAWNLVEEFRLTQVRLTVTAPEGQTLDFLQSVSVYISADSLAEMRIASKENVPAGTGGVLELDIPQNGDLKPYLQKNNFQLRVQVTTDQTINRNVDVAVYTKFFVDAKILGI
jgi:hypothetical protein